MEEKKRIMSGMRPTGRLHLGHYMGVITNWVNLQNEYDCYFSVADWHALTTGYDKTEHLKDNVYNVVIDWLACGIDPKKATIYVQSAIPEIAELNIYLGMVTPQNWVERDPTLKDMAKILKTKEGTNSQIGFGLMGYPVLMTADILAVNAHYVPVGIDQVAHVELTRDMARRFNHVYNTDYFNEPAVKLNNCPLLSGVDGAKMGKSFNNDIKISDDEETTKKRIMQCITDRSRARKTDFGHPDKCEVAFKYWKIFGNEEEVALIEEECKAGKRGCADCKRKLGEKVNEHFREIRDRRKYYENHIDEVKSILENGNAKSREVSKKILTDVRNIIGMY